MYHVDVGDKFARLLSVENTIQSFLRRVSFIVVQVYSNHLQNGSPVVGTHVPFIEINEKVTIIYKHSIFFLLLPIMFIFSIENCLYGIDGIIVIITFFLIFDSLMRLIVASSIDIYDLES